MFDWLASQLEGVSFSLLWESVAIEVLGDVAVVQAFGPARLTTPGRDAEFRYRMTGVLVRNNARWLWRVYHGSEPGAW